MLEIDFGDGESGLVRAGRPVRAVGNDVTNPKTVADRLGIKPGQTFAPVDFDAPDLTCQPAVSCTASAAAAVAARAVGAHSRA